MFKLSSLDFCDRCLRCTPVSWEAIHVEIFDEMLPGISTPKSSQ